MVTVTVIVGVTAEFLVDSIEGVTEAHPALSQEWIGLILLPIGKWIALLSCRVSE